MTSSSSTTSARHNNQVVRFDRIAYARYDETTAITISRVFVGILNGCTSPLRAISITDRAIAIVQTSNANQAIALLKEITS